MDDTGNGTVVSAVRDSTSTTQTGAPWWNRRPVRVGAAAAAGVAFVLWWWWPSLARDPDRIDVAVVGVGQVTEADEPIQRRIREQGMSVAMVPREPCADISAVAAALDDLDPSVVVLSPSTPDSCAGQWNDLVAASQASVGDATFIVLGQTGVLDPRTLTELEPIDVVIADPTRLLGDASVVRAGCQWWDDCEPDGQVTLRDDTGALTPAGAQRVARVLVGTIP
jgi:hypothetical protein